MRRLALALAAGGVLAASPATALAATPPLTGSFAFEDQFTVQPGVHRELHLFPIAIDLQSDAAAFRARPRCAGPAGTAAPLHELLDRHRHRERQVTSSSDAAQNNSAGSQDHRLAATRATPPQARSTTRAPWFGGVVIQRSAGHCFPPSPDGNGVITRVSLRGRPCTRDSTVTPPRFRSSARHCPDLKQARQAKLERGTQELQARHQVSEPRKEQRDSENSTVQNHHRAHQRPSNHRGRPGGTVMRRFSASVVARAMPVTRYRLAVVAAVSAFALLVLPGCSSGGSTSGPAKASTSSPSSPVGQTYASKAFAVPLTITVPASFFKAQPNSDTSTFLTWFTGSTENEGRFHRVRFLLPVALYRPGQTAPETPPKDYLTYLRGLSRQGATLADEKKITVDGHSATLMTVTTEQHLDGVNRVPPDPRRTGRGRGLLRAPARGRSPNRCHRRQREDAARLGGYQQGCFR